MCKKQSNSCIHIILYSILVVIISHSLLRFVISMNVLHTKKSQYYERSIDWNTRVIKSWSLYLTRFGSADGQKCTIVSNKI